MPWSGLSIEERNNLHLDVFEYHKRKGFSIKETAKHFLICATTVKKWVSRVQLGEEKEKSRKPKNRKVIILSPKEIKEISQELKKWNKCSDRIRNVIAPAFTKFAVDSNSYKFSYSFFQKLSVGILGSIPRKYKEKKEKKTTCSVIPNTPKKQKKMISRKAKKTRRINRIADTWKALSKASESRGWWQIDMAYFYPTYYNSKCLFRDYIKRHLSLARTIYNDNLKMYSSNVVELEKFNEAVRKECLDDFFASVKDIKKIEEFHPKLYQYTGINPVTRKVVRMVSEYHDAHAAKTFLFKIEKESGEKVEFAQTDNGTNFEAGSTFFSRLNHPERITFHSYLETKKRVHIRNPKGCPWLNGFVESQHRLDRERFYNNNYFTSLSDIEEKMKRYGEVHIINVATYRIQHKKQ